MNPLAHSRPLLAVALAGVTNEEAESARTLATGSVAFRSRRARLALRFAPPYDAEVAEFPEERDAQGSRDRGAARAYWQLATSRSVVRAALRISLVVGTLLNALNLGPSLARGVDGVILLRLLANYLVPYCVATIGAVSQAARRDDAR